MDREARQKLFVPFHRCETQAQKKSGKSYILSQGSQRSQCSVCPGVQWGQVLRWFFLRSGPSFYDWEIPYSHLLAPARQPCLHRGPFRMVRFPDQPALWTLAEASSPRPGRLPSCTSTTMSVGDERLAEADSGTSSLLSYSRMVRTPVVIETGPLRLRKRLLYSRPAGGGEGGGTQTLDFCSTANLPRLPSLSNPKEKEQPT